MKMMVFCFDKDGKAYTVRAWGLDPYATLYREYGDVNHIIVAAEGTENQNTEGYEEIMCVESTAHNLKVTYEKVDEVDV